MDYTTFIHNIFIGFIALFPVINPIGTAFIVNPYFNGIERKDRKKLVLKIALYIFYLCVVTLISGSWILQLFGLSIPVVKFAGGIMICKIGWGMISGHNDIEDKSDDLSKPDNRIDSIKSKLFFPITFPVTAGAGTISVLFTLSARGAAQKGVDSFLFNTSSILISVIMMCVLVYFMYLNTELIIRKIGPKNEVILNRVMAFLIFCVGLQIASGGIVDFVKQYFLT